MYCSLLKIATFVGQTSSYQMQYNQLIKYDNYDGYTVVILAVLIILIRKDKESTTKEVERLRKSTRLHNNNMFSSKHC